MTREERDRLIHDIGLSDTVGQLRYNLERVASALPVADPAPVAVVTVGTRAELVSGLTNVMAERGDAIAEAVSYPEFPDSSTAAPAPTELEAAVDDLCNLATYGAVIAHTNEATAKAIARVRAAMGRGK